MNFQALVMCILSLSGAVSFAQEQTTTVLPASTDAVVAAPASNQTQTKVSTPEDSSGRSRFGISLFSLGGVERTQLQNTIDQNPSIYFFENYLQFSYKIDKDLRMAFRYSFNYSTAGSDKFGKEYDDKADTRDASLLLTFYNVMDEYLPSNFGWKVQPRLYLPTSEKSKAQGMISSLRLENELKVYTQDYSYGRIWVQPHYFFQRSTVYTDDKGKIKTTDMFTLKHGADYNQNLSKIFSIVPGFEIEDNWSNSSSANNKDEFRNTTIDYRLGLEMRIAKPLTFTLGYGHQRDLIKVGEFRDQFTLMTNATLY